MKSLREELYDYFWKPYSHRNYENQPFLLKRDRENVEKQVDDIIKIFEKQIYEIIDHTTIGECPECDKDALKRFKELLRE